MFAFPKKSIQAIEAVAYIACDGGSAAVSGKEIADALGLPARHLEQLMQRLVHGGVLRGVRGPRGGYLLARERRRISVADILEALREEPEAAETSTPTAARLVLPLIREAEAAALEHLSSVTLAELGARAALLRPVRTGTRGGGDFSI